MGLGAFTVKGPGSAPSWGTKIPQALGAMAWPKRENDIMPFAATEMDLGMIILRKSEGERQIPYDVTFMWI